MQAFKNDGTPIENLEEVDWSWEAWPAITPNWHINSHKGDHPDDNMEHHIDLGCGTIKKGRIGVDHKFAPGVNLVIDLDNKEIKLPFQDSSIRSIISHHAFEHIGEGFLPLIDEIYRVLKPGGKLRAITPLFPSTAAVQDPDHCRYFMAPTDDNCTWDSFTGVPGHPHWCSSFSVPYTNAKFTKTALWKSPAVAPELQWGPEDQRELRVTLTKTA